MNSIIPVTPGRISSIIRITERHRRGSHQVAKICIRKHKK